MLIVMLMIKKVNKICLVGEKCLIFVRFGEKLPTDRNHDKPHKNAKHCVAI